MESKLFVVALGPGSFGGNLPEGYSQGLEWSLWMGWSFWIVLVCFSFSLRIFFALWEYDLFCFLGIPFIFLVVQFWRISVEPAFQ